MVRYPVIVALDGISQERALEIAKALSGRVWGFKVRDLYLRYGPGIVPMLKKFGRVFVDLKFFDNPQAVAENVRAVYQQGADLITVHARGSVAMLKTAASEGGKKILAVTELTSESSGDSVLALVAKAHAAGIDGVVCSAHEAKEVRRLYPKIAIVTPGIREAGANTHDQVRVASAKEALTNGSDYLVIGRPLITASDPVAALESMFKK